MIRSEARSDLTAEDFIEWVPEPPKGFGGVAGCELASTWYRCREGEFRESLRIVLDVVTLGGWSRLAAEGGQRA